jgi:hypothetical protein
MPSCGITIMKLTVLCALVLSFQMVFAQFRNFGDEIKARKKAQEKSVAESTGTNVVRIANGKAYHVLRSTNWVTLPPHYSQRLKVESVQDSKLIVSVEDYYPDGYSYAHNQYIVVTNHPSQSTAITGNILKDFRAIQIGRVQCYGDTVAIYDFGTLPVAAKTNATSK